jgi:low temperature requirement protein LtrA
MLSPWNRRRSRCVAATVFRHERRFTLNAAHFAERHGLIILIALGESVILEQAKDRLVATAS